MLRRSSLVRVVALLAAPSPGCAQEAPTHLGRPSRARRSCIAGLVALLSLPSVGCAQEAPEGLDNLSRFLFDRFEPAEGLELGAQETEIRDAVKKLKSEFAALEVSVDKPFTGTLSDLEKANVQDLEGVGDRADKIDLAQGFALANISTCTVQQEVNLVASNRAMEIHPDVYESYEKDFDDDTAPFKANEVSLLRWRTTYKLLPPPVGSAYRAKLRAGGRRIAAADGVGELFMTRVHLLEPAKFDGDGSRFEQDYQYEIYVDNEDGTLTHFYAMWRHMVLGIVDSSSELFIGQTLSGFVDFEDRVEQACADGKLDE
jgi:hypothetical protein